jgi:hypothetical protein
MGRAKAKPITLPAGIAPQVMVANPLPMAAPPATLTNLPIIDVTTTMVAEADQTGYDSLFDLGHTDYEDAERDHVNITAILANKDKKPAAVSAISLRKRNAPKPAPKAAPPARKRKAPPPRCNSPVAARKSLRPKKR